METAEPLITGAEIGRLIDSAWKKAWNGETDARTAMMAIKDQVEALLKQHHDYIGTRRR